MATFLLDQRLAFSADGGVTVGYDALDGLVGLEATDPIDGGFVPLARGVGELNRTVGAPVTFSRPLEDFSPMGYVKSYDTDSLDAAIQPVTANVNPAPGTPIDAGTPLEFDIIGTGPFGLIVSYEALPRELALDAKGFTTEYIASTLTTITVGRYHCTLRRNGGWPATPFLDEYALVAAVGGS